MSLRVLRAAPKGPSVQDGGRVGYRKFGVPPGGVFDRESAFLANAFVGNSSLLPCLELPLSGGVFEFADETSVAVVGAECRVYLDGKELPSQCRLAVRKGSVVEVGPALSGSRSYLAVTGGFEGRSVLGSMSGTYLLENHLLACPNRYPKSPARLAAVPRSLIARMLRFIPGPQSSFFDMAGFCSAAFKVLHHSDRRGIRLDGSFQGSEEEIPSEPSCVGAIQITPSGMPILLGVDGPTIGGYPKIGCVITADLSVLGQLRPGDEVRFEEVALEEALAASGEESSRLRTLLKRLRLG